MHHAIFNTTQLPLNYHPITTQLPLNNTINTSPGVLYILRIPPQVTGFCNLSVRYLVSFTILIERPLARVENGAPGGIQRSTNSGEP